MLNLKAIFDIEAPLQNLMHCTLALHWFPELSGVWTTADAVTEKLEKEGRLQVRQLHYQSADGYRYTALYSVFFDGEPLMLVQEGGRSGRDHQKRWKVSQSGYLATLQYLMCHMMAQKLAELEEDGYHDEQYFDLQESRYPEEVLYFYSTDLVETLGFEKEATRKDVMLLRNERGLLSTVDTDMYLVVLKEGAEELPEYIRRNAFVMKREREIPFAEVESQNPQMAQYYKAEGVAKIFVYAACPRPSDEVVQPI